MREPYITLYISDTEYIIKTLLCSTSLGLWLYIRFSFFVSSRKRGDVIVLFVYYAILGFGEFP